MDNADDAVMLTSEERRLIGALEESIRDDGTTLFTWWRRFGQYRYLGLAGGARDAGAAVLLVGGAVLMVATFAQWPALAAAGVLIQTVAIRRWVTRLGPAVAIRSERWALTVRPTSNGRKPQP